MFAIGPFPLTVRKQQLSKEPVLLRLFYSLLMGTEAQTFKRAIWQYLSKLQIHIPFEPVILQLKIDPINILALSIVYKKTKIEDERNVYQ